MEYMVRAYTPDDIDGMVAVWNEVVTEGRAFPQEEPLGLTDGAAFFAAQTCCGAAIDKETGEVLGMYILHPNNVGRCGHIANASYAVKGSCRGQHIGRALVQDCMARAAAAGFRILQFNAVVRSNTGARRLYESLGFTPLGVIPQGFRRDGGVYEDIVPYYIALV